MKNVFVAVGMLAILLMPQPSDAAQDTIYAYRNLLLTNAEADAVISAPDVNLAQAQLQENLALLSAARAASGPAVTAGYVEAPQGGSPGGTIAQRLTTVGAQYVLGDLLAYAPLVAQAQANLDAARLGYEDAQRTERIHVIALYYGALAARATLDARIHALTNAQADQSAAQKRFSAGAAPRLDVVRAQVAVAKSTADLENARAVAGNAGEALAVETGTSKSALQSLRAQPADAYAPAGDAVTTALRRRPEIGAAQASARAARAAVQIAKRAIMPTITVSAGYTTGVDSGVRISGPTASLQALLPLGGAARDRVAAERARGRQADARLASIERRIKLEVSSALRSYAATTRASAAATAAREAAARELGATEVGYVNGASSSLEISAARQTYTQARVDELHALYARAQARATLALLIGE
ncbi:MAG: TolC family protein [Candidatus Eremiobacteraeota bacterium]|nr:TolC family protein [Candidatus Eremiobacteraeota bacterium]